VLFVMLKEWFLFMVMFMVVLLLFLLILVALSCWNGTRLERVLYERSLRSESLLESLRAKAWVGERNKFLRIHGTLMAFFAFNRNRFDG
jgi:hypothetical protein